MTSAEGDASHSEGSDTHAKGNHSHTEGGLTKTTTGADFGHAEGLSTEVSGKYSHSEGSSTKAQGIASHSEGQETVASGNISHSEGYKTNATGNHAHSEGGNTIASADSAHSEGDGTEATSIRSHAEGSGTKTGALVDLSQTDPDEPAPPSTGGGSSGGGSTGEGGGTSTPAITTGASHSEGYRTSAFGWGSHSEGGSTIAYNHYTHSEGERTKAYGEGSHSEGLATITGNEADLTKGKGAHAEGYATKATGGHAHSEGYGTEASGAGSHSEGGNTTASGEYAHSEGEGTAASGYASKAFGQNTKATAIRSIAGGYNAEAKGDTSFSFGFNTKTTNEGEVAFGKYNKSNANTLFSIGIGKYDGEGRRNAFEVTTDGKVTIPSLQNHYTKSETYNKTEIDSKVSSVYKYKGTVPSPMLLPDNNEIGDVYNTIFAGYVPIHKENNYTLTGISYEGNLTTDTEITLTFNNNITTNFAGTPIDNADIAFWFDSNYFFIGKIISHSSNSYVVKIANLDIEDTMYSQNPCIEAIMSYNSNFSSGSITSITLQSIHYWNDVGSAIRFEYIPKGGNVAYTGSEWDSLGTTIDTSNFATKELLAEKINIADSGFDYIIKSADDFKLTTYQSKRIYLINNVIIPKSITFSSCDIISSFKSISSEAYNINFVDCTINNVNFNIDCNSVYENSPGSSFTNCTLNNCDIYWGQGIYTNNISSCNFINCNLHLPSLGSSPNIDGFTTFTNCKFTFDSSEYPLYLNSNAKVFMSGVLFNNDYSETYTEIQSSETNASLCMIGCSSTNTRAIKIQNSIEVKVNTDLNFLTTQSV